MGSAARRAVQAGIPEPDKPMTGLYHGSRWLGSAVNGGWKEGMYTPAKGTDLTGHIDPTHAAIEGMLGPASIYTTTHPEAAAQYGPLYQVEVSASPNNFVEVDRGSRRLIGAPAYRMDNSPLSRLLDTYEQTTGQYLPSHMGVQKILWDVGFPQAREKLRGSIFDPEATNIEEFKGETLDDMTKHMLRSGGGTHWDDDLYQKLPGQAISNASHEASQAYRGAVQDFVKRSGVAGFSEKGPQRSYWDQSIPNIHYAVYDPATIIRLIKLGILPAVAAGSQAVSTGDKR